MFQRGWKMTIHWVVQDTVHIVLIVASVRWVAIKDFTDTINACSVIIAGPEGFLDVFDGINAQTVN
jgi:hypothetical protein